MKRLNLFRRPLARAGSSVALAAICMGHATPANAFFFGLGGIVDAFWSIGETLVGGIESWSHGWHEHDYHFPGYWGHHDPWFDHLEEEVFVRDDVPPACADFQRVQGCWGTDRTHRIYNRAVQKGRKFVLQRWSEQQSCDELESFVDSLNKALMEQAPAYPRPKKMCRFGGFSDGVMEALAGIRERCAVSCADDGKLMGKVSAGVYCSLSQLTEGLKKPSDYMRGPVKLCGQNFQEACDATFVTEARTFENDKGVCIGYTEGEYTEVFDSFKTTLCAYRVDGPIGGKTEGQGGQNTQQTNSGNENQTAGDTSTQEASTGEDSSTGGEASNEEASSTGGESQNTDAAGSDTAGSDDSTQAVEESTDAAVEESTDAPVDETTGAVSEESTEDPVVVPDSGDGSSTSGEAQQESDSTGTGQGVLASESGPDSTDTQDSEGNQEEPRAATPAPVGGPAALLLLGLGLGTLNRRRK